MKKIIYVLLVCLMFIPNIVFGSEKELNMYLFYGDGCPHCSALEDFLDGYIKKNKNIKLYKYEVWYNEENAKKYSDVHEILEDNSSGIPYLIIGNKAITGFMEDVTEDQIKNYVSYYSGVKFKDEVGIYLGVVEELDDYDELTTKEDTIDDLSLPKKLKNIVKKSPLIISTILIGLVDGFNPCAMWILIFLISMLLGMENKKRKWTLGIVFLLTSSLVYFLFLVSWLNLAIFLDKIIYIRVGISIISIIFGAYSIVKFLSTLNKDTGCEVVDSKNRKRIIKSIRKIVKEKSFFLALLGIVLLAASVNIIELLCSLGLPVMYSQILVINDITNTGKILYSLLYVLFFLIDDIIIFVIAMKTLEIKTISNKFGKYSHLIGGIIMLVIGLLMVLKPEWLMFNF